MEYVDLVEDLRVFYVEEKYKNKPKDNVEYWAISNAMLVLYDNLDTDPIQTLDEIRNNYEINSVFSKQLINKENNKIAADAISGMIDFLERRK